MQGGHILIDGQDIARVTQDSLREAIGIVPQDISLFNRTIRENLCHARPDATDAEIMAAAETARCREFIEALPQGTNAPVEKVLLQAPGVSQDSAASGSSTGLVET